MKNTSNRLYDSIKFCRLFFSTFIILSFLFVCNVEAYTSRDCIRCHKIGSNESKLHIKVEELRSSVHHENITCLDCHTGVQDNDHFEIKESGVVDCNQCHETVNKHGSNDHAAGRPECYTCHGSHGILPKENKLSTINAVRLKETCWQCHPAECEKGDYISWFSSLHVSFHGKDDFSQQYEKGDCLGCHQGKAAHGELNPVTDQNCYTCHLDFKEKKSLLGSIHPGINGKMHIESVVAAAILHILILFLLWNGFRFYKRKKSEKTRGDR